MEPTGRAWSLPFELEEGDVVGLVDAEDAVDLDLLALDIEAFDVEGLGDDMIGRDDDVLAQGQGRPLRISALSEP